MKNFIFIPAILFGAFLTLSGCYTYLSLSNDAKLAYVPYEPYYPPEPAPPPDPGPPGCPEPGPRPNIIIYNPPPPSDPYQRPKEISYIRNEGEGRNSDTSRRRR